MNKQSSNKAKRRALKSLPDQEIVIRSDDLAVLVDETGHEDLGLASTPLFGFGGIAVTGRRAGMLDRAWRDLKRVQFGDESYPLHAAKLNLNEDQIQAFSEFFRKRFFRFAFLLRQPVLHREGTDFIQIIGNFMLKELTGLFSTSARPLPKRILLLFETSERLSPKIMKSFPEFSIEVDGLQIPIIGAFIPKSPDTTLLEMADFTIYHAQRSLLGKPSIADYIFGRADGLDCFRVIDLTEINVQRGDHKLKFEMERHPDNPNKGRFKMSGSWPSQWPIEVVKLGPAEKAKIRKAGREKDRKMPAEVDPTLPYSTAKDYAQSAFVMMTGNSRYQAAGDTHFYLAFHMLCGFAVVLYLKAYLRRMGVSEHELRTEFGHKLEKLKNRAVELGLGDLKAADFLVAYLGEKHEDFGYRYMKADGNYKYKSMVAIFQALSELDNRVDEKIGASVSYGKKFVPQYWSFPADKDWRLPR